MAREIHVFSVTVPANTPIATPQVTVLTLPQRVVDQVDVRVPPGPRGQVGFALGSSGVAVLPQEANTFIVTDDELVSWPLEGLWDSGGWELHAYNTGLYDHKLEVRFMCSLVGSTVAQSVPAVQGGDLGIPPVGSLPEIPPQLPTLPQLPPLPALPQPPTLPPAPTLPGLGTTPAAPPASTYNFWSDAMGKLLTYPDQSAGPRFDKVFLLPDGSVGWYAFTGGAGQYQNYNKPAGSLGGKFVDVAATFVLYQGKVYLYIEGTDKNGISSFKVMDPVLFEVVSDWLQQPNGSSTELPLSQRVST